MSSRHKEAGSLRHVAISPLFHTKCQTLTIDGLIDLSCTSVVAEKSIAIPVETQLYLSGWENKTQTSLFTGLNELSFQVPLVFNSPLSGTGLLRISYHSKKKRMCVYYTRGFIGMAYPAWVGECSGGRHHGSAKKMALHSGLMPT